MKKKAIKYLCGLFVVVLIAYTAIGFFGDFHLKGMACKGGFMTSLWQKESENIKAVCGENLTEDEMWQIRHNMSIDRDNDRIINAKYIDENAEEVNLQCKIKWFWSDNYEWTKAS